MTGKVLGIDLGTTNSVVAVANGHEAVALTDSEGRRLIPSVVSFHPDGSILVGHEARERRLVDAKNTVYSTKRLIGRPFSSSEVQRAKERFAFDLEPTKVGGIQVRVRRGTFALPELSAMVLRHLRRVAEDALGEPCGRAVITVPANFNELQRSATQAAGKVAGLDVLRILNEPTAATLAYGLSKEGAEKVAVYDLGGGTFDFTILDLDKQVFEVVSTAGDTFLGGDDIDLFIAETMADACLRQHRFDARAEAQAFERMRAAAEWAKCQLSAVREVDVTLEELFNDSAGKAVDFSFHLTRDVVEGFMRPLFERSFEVVNDALRSAGRRPREIDSVVLVGGSTRIPLVRSMVDEFFGKPARFDIDPDLVVAQGAAIHGFLIAGERPGKSKAVGRVALKKTIQQLGAAPPSRIPRQPAFAPEEGRDDKQARFVDEGDERLPPIVRPPVPRVAKAVPVPVPMPVASSASAEPRGPTWGGTDDVAPPSRQDRPAAMEVPSAPSSAAVAVLRTVGVAGTTKLQAGDDPFDSQPTRISEPPRKAPPSLRPPPASSPLQGPPLDLPSSAFVVADIDPELGQAILEESAPVRANPKPREATRPFRTGTGLDMPIPDFAPPLSAAAPPTSPAIASSSVVRDLGQPPQGFGQPPQGFGQPPQGFGQPPQGFGQPPPGFGQPQPATAPRQLAPRQPVVAMPNRAAPLLMDVTPLSLGIETAGSYCQQIVQRNAPIPTESSRVFATARDGQIEVELKICQGESNRFDENQALGALMISPIREARRGEVRIEITFMIDQNGILDVRATDMDAQRAQAIRIALRGGADAAEVEAMRQRQESLFGS
jgi:molecular chaperone DnaK